MRKALTPLVQLSRSPEINQAKQVYQKIGSFDKNHVIEWLKAYWHNRIGRKHPFQTWKTHSGIFKFNNTAKISLAGDWGTGTDEAFEVGQQIKASNPDYTIHLGDVYYVGDTTEVEENFLGGKHGIYSPVNWPTGKYGEFALSGNHEMFARGFGYFDTLLPAMSIVDGLKSVKQEASYFCLENDYWRVIGLDTAYNSIGWPILENISSPKCDLTQEQLDWLYQTVQPYKDTKATILLTHHQYYSAFENQYKAAASQLSMLFHKPVLWFWGHEHRLAVYDKYNLDNLEAYGRCIGHGGMPIEINCKIKNKDVLLLFTDNRAYPNDEGLHIGYNGFVNLTFDTYNLKVDYVDLKGTIIRTENWYGNTLR
jgi:hypothetical protein